MDAGVILAGGRSTRFGEDDKAVAELAGKPMIRRVADRVAHAVDEIVVNCRSDQVNAIEPAMASVPTDVSFAIDETPDLGPMAGIRNGLSATDAEYGFVVACDMPFVDPTLIEYLFNRAQDHDAAVPRVGGEWFQTTQAVYRTSAMAAASERALERGDRKIIAAMFELDYVVVEEAELADHGWLPSFDNINTPEEFADAAARLQG